MADTGRTPRILTAEEFVNALNRVEDSPPYDADAYNALRLHDVALRAELDTANHRHERQILLYGLHLTSCRFVRTRGESSCNCGWDKVLAGLDVAPQEPGTTRAHFAVEGCHDVLVHAPTDGSGVCGNPGCWCDAAPQEETP